MSYDVKVKIDLAKPVGKAGFGVPLILEANTGKKIDYTEVSSIAEVVAAGFPESSRAYKAAALMFSQNNAPKTIALCGISEGQIATALSDVSLTSKPWRQLVLVSRDVDFPTQEIPAIVSAVEALEGKMLFLCKHNNFEYAEGLNTSGINRTVLFYGGEDEELGAAALVGEAAGKTAGSFTYKNMILKGIKPQALTVTEVEAIHDKGGIAFVTKAGDNVTSEGKTAGGEYIDIIDSEDYIIQQITYRTQKVLNSADKVPYDNNGIALLESVAVDVLQEAYNNGMIATKEDGTPDYSVSYALREDTTETDRANRNYFGGSFAFALAGAIHHVEITGTISY